MLVSDMKNHFFMCNPAKASPRLTLSSANIFQEKSIPKPWVSKLGKFLITKYIGMLSECLRYTVL